MKRAQTKALPKEVSSRSEHLSAMRLYGCCYKAP